MAIQSTADLKDALNELTRAVNVAHETISGDMPRRTSNGLYERMLAVGVKHEKAEEYASALEGALKVLREDLESIVRETGSIEHITERIVREHGRLTRNSGAAVHL